MAEKDWLAGVLILEEIPVGGLLFSTLLLEIPEILHNGVGVIVSLQEPVGLVHVMLIDVLEGLRRRMSRDPSETSDLHF